MKHSCWLVFTVLGSLAGHAFAQAPAASDANRTDPPAADAPPAEAEPPAPPPPAEAEPTLEPEHVGSAKPTGAAESVDQEMTLDRMVLSSANRIDLNLFGDVSLVDATDKETAFAIGPIGFQVTARLAERLVGRTEFVMKFAGAASILDIERLYLEYRTDHWGFVAGRTHTEFGYWNTAFHHGTWLQLTIKRPRVLGFEGGGGVLPMHAVGLTASYGPKRGDRGLEAVVAVGNGRGRAIDISQNTADNNAPKSVLVRLGAVGYGHPALRFGINVAIDNIAAEDAAVRPLLPNAEMLELVTGYFLSLRGERLVVYSETYNVLHRGLGKIWQFTDGFLLAGYRFGPVIPFGMFEARRGDGLADPYYSPAAMVGSSSVPPANFVEGTAGLRYEVNSWSALKLELAVADFASGSSYRAEVNWSFGR